MKNLMREYIDSFKNVVIKEQQEDFTELINQLEIYQSNINGFCEQAKQIKDKNKLWIITNELAKLSKVLSKQIDGI